MEFEAGITRLEQIVSKLEAGDLSLAESVALYEEGVQVSAACQKELTNAKLKVQEESKEVEA